jgi:hypothetical protein
MGNHGGVSTVGELWVRMGREIINSRTRGEGENMEITL